MSSETKRPELRQVVAQLTAIDQVVALDVGALSDCLARVAEMTEQGLARRLAGVAGKVDVNAGMVAAIAPVASSTASKIILIPVAGPLTPRGSWYGSSLSGIAAQVTRAAADPDVAGIILDFDTPGGTVAGTSEAADAVREASAKKPVCAVVNSLAASAGYWIASQAGELVTSPSGDVGSIGAMIMHVDIGKALADAGVNVTMIRSKQSPYKNEAHPFAPLSDEANSFLQARADDAGADFIKAVAGGRRVTQAKVKEEFGQGRIYGAREALARGMVDRVATLDQVIAGMMQTMPRNSAPRRRRSALAFE